MKVERREVVPIQHEYVLILTPDEARRLHSVFQHARWNEDLCNQVQRALEDACPDKLRRMW